MEEVSCRFCGKKDGDGHLFWECAFLPFMRVRELSEFATLLVRDRSNWPRCLLWHGWLPGLGVAGEHDPWAASLGWCAETLVCIVGLVGYGRMCLGLTPGLGQILSPLPISGSQR